MMKHVAALLGISAFLLLCLGSIGFCDTSKSTFAPPLTGQEVLFELSDPTGELPDGIYAWNPATDPDISHLRLLVKNGHHPVWSPHYQRFAYLFNGDVWISDKAGNKAAALPNHESEHIAAENQVLQWSPDGKLYFTRQSPIWGSAVYVTPSLETATVKETRQLFNFPFNLVYAIRPRKEPVTSRFQPIQSLTTYNWHNILASNNASFSPDGGSVAMEVYPAFDQDLLRYKSSVRVYEVMSDSLHSQELIHETATFVDPWFRQDEASPRIKGPGHPLLPDITNTTMKPLWSPNGQWIAVTVADTENASTYPVIANPDGTMLARIDTLNFGPGVFGELTTWGWTPADFSSLDKEALQQLDTIPTVFRQAIGWSDEGKYLWMQEKNDGISVAMEENGKWFIKRVKTNTLDIAYKPAMVSFRGNQVLWLNDSGDSREARDIAIFDAETGKTKTYPLRWALKVLSVDW